jgi:hypothetical protein
VNSMTTVVVTVVATVFIPSTMTRALPPHKGERCHPHKREHNNGYIKGSLVLCLLGYAGQAFVSLSSGGVRRRLRLSASAPRLTPPDYPHAVLVASQIGSILSHVEGPDTRYTTCQFIPPYPFLGSGMVYGVLPHEVSWRDPL